MFGLGKRKDEGMSDALRTYVERVTLIEGRVTSLELQLDSFRDKVLRKIQHAQTEEPQGRALKPGQKVRQ